MRAAKPCIYADYNAPGRISAHAAAQPTSVYMLGIDFFYSTIDASLQIILSNQRLTVPTPSIEPKSAVAAIVAVQLLQQKLPVTEATLQQAMQLIHIVGRQQWLDIPFPTLYDVAHNPQAVRSLRDSLQQRHSKGRILAIFSALADKDIVGNIAPLKGLVDHWYPVVLAVKRAANEDKLRLAFQANDVMIDDYYFDPQAAYQAALAVAVPGDVIIVYGSFYLIGGIMGQFVTL
jgi:dihydrofolate synthase/folylpolyglutamate synthase